MFRKTVLFAVAALFLAILSTPALSQVTGGTVTGTVVDAQEKVVPNATVTLSSKATGQNITTQTTDSGSYTFPTVSVGDYTITIESAGFASATQEVKVALNQTTTVDATLQASGVTGSVDITVASEALVQTDSSQLGKTFEVRQVQDLPIFGDQNSLALLAPNVVERSSGVQGSGGTVGGVRPRGNSFNVDGVDNNDPGVTGPSTSVIQDAVQEFTLLQNNFNAEFGAGAGGIFNTITRSGTNEFHGSGFLYVGSQKLNAATTGQEAQFKRGELTELPLFKQARYGATLGGPVISNKLFFFGAVQRDFVDEAKGGAQYFAPTAAGLTQIAALPGVSPFVIDLLRNNLTLAGSATAEATAEFGTVLGTPGIPFGPVIINNPGGYTDNAFQSNIDYLPGAKDQFHFRFSYDRVRAEQEGNGNIKFNNLFAYDTRLFSANWIRTLGSSIVNDMRLSYRRVIEDYPLKDPAFNTFPNITVDTLNLLLGPSGNLPQGSPVGNSYQLYDAIGYSRGKHSFKFGGEMRRLITTSVFLPRARGDYDYSDLDVLLTDRPPDSLNIRGVGSGSFAGNQYQFFFFGQDDWKVKPNLTLNLGLRYEYNSLPRDAATQALNSISSVPDVIDFRVPKTDKNNFGPRVGLAYSPEVSKGDGFFNELGRFLFGDRGQSSLRLNFGISYLQNFQNLLYLNLPPQFQQEVNNGGPLSQFLQSGGVPSALRPVDTQAGARAATSSYIVNQTSPYTMAWTASYQRELTPTMAIEFRYQGTRVRKLPVQVRLNGFLVNPKDLALPTFFNQPTAEQLAGRPTLFDIAVNSPTLGVQALNKYGFEGTVTGFLPQGTSQYDGGSISLTRRMSRGLALTAAYTFSKTIDNASNELNSSAFNPRRAEYAFDQRNERGLSALDVPHRFVLSLNYDFLLFNKNENSIVRRILGDWQVNAIFQAQSGQPITIRSSVDSNVDFDTAGDRVIFNPNGVAGTSSRVCPLNSAGQYLAPDLSADGFFAPGTVTTDINQCGLGVYGPTNAVAYLVVNPNAQFIDAGYAAASNLGRNTFRSKGYNRTDAVFLKNIRFGGEGKVNLQVGAEIFNLFNQRIRTISGVGDFSAAFGIAGNPSFNDYSIGNFGGRLIQMRAKLIF